MPEIEPRIVQTVVQYSAITSLEDNAASLARFLRRTEIGTELHQQWLFSSTGLLNRSALHIEQACTEIRVFRFKTPCISH
jgi:hypothetical protein